MRCGRRPGQPSGMGMNVPRKLLGSFVEITWRDPNYAKGDISTILRGRAALATWVEYGQVYDVTDGVVLLAHSLAISPGGEKPDEIARTAIDEALIEKLVVLVPQGETT